MFRLSYRFMARDTVRKGVTKAAKPAKSLVPLKAITQPNASILNAPIAPPLSMQPPVMPSLDTMAAKAAPAATKMQLGKKNTPKKQAKKTEKKAVAKPKKSAATPKIGNKKSAKGASKKIAARNKVNAKPKIPKIKGDATKGKKIKLSAKAKSKR